MHISTLPSFQSGLSDCISYLVYLGGKCSFKEYSKVIAYFGKLTVREEKKIILFL
jgi:hypothetical protein